MPFERPTLAELQARVPAEIGSRLGTGPLLRNSYLYVLGQVLAGLSHEMHGHLAWAAKQIMPDTAEAEQLDGWASIFGIQRLAATKATGSATFTGSGSSLIPLGTLVQRADGVQFSVDADTYLSSGTASVDITAVEAAVDGNTDVGVLLTLVSPVDGIDSTATVEDDGSGSGLSGGTDRESDGNLLERLLLRIQDPPHGGAESDYEFWAKEISGVTRVWILPLQLGIGTVEVFFTIDDDPTGPIPGSAKVQEVQDHLDSKRPATAEVFVEAPTASPLDPDISINPDTTTIRNAIEAALEDLIRREAEVGGTLLISHIREAISTAVGEVDHILNDPTADVTETVGNLSTLGTITWSAWP